MTGAVFTSIFYIQLQISYFNCRASFYGSSIANPTSEETHDWCNRNSVSWLKDKTKTKIYSGQPSQSHLEVLFNVFDENKVIRIPHVLP